MNTIEDRVQYLKVHEQALEELRQRMEQLNAGMIAPEEFWEATLPLCLLMKED